MKLLASSFSSVHKIFSALLAEFDPDLYTLDIVLCDLHCQMELWPCDIQVDLPEGQIVFKTIDRQFHSFQAPSYSVARDMITCVCFRVPACSSGIICLVTLLDN